MRQINLQEHQSTPLTLSTAELQTLLREAKALDLSIAPTSGEGSEYILRPGSTVGAVEVGGLSVLIQPKIGIPQLLSLACYAIGKVRFQREDFDYPDVYALPDVLAQVLASHARRAFSGVFSTATAPRMRRCTPSGGASGSTSRYGAGPGSPCPSRCGTTSSPTTSWPTAW